MALSVIRSLGRQGIPIFALFGRGQDQQPYLNTVRSSRFIKKVNWFDAQNYEADCIRSLIELGKSIPSQAVLFPVSDRDMAMVSKNRASLQEFYRLLMPSDATLTMLLNKEQFYQFADQQQLPIPRTFMPAAPADIYGIADTIQYPCIVKPSWRSEEWIRRFGSKKVLRCASFAELRDQFCRTFAYFEPLIIQEIVPGPETNIVCSFTYLNKDSEPLEVFVCRKIRQFPPHFGNTALAEAISLPQIDEATRQICKKLKLVGYISIEFKLDPRDGVYKILEITPSRVNHQAGIADICGMNIPYIWYSHLLGTDARAKISYPPYRWASEVNDLRSARLYLKKREWTVLNWIRSYRNVRRWEVFSRDDILPFVILILSVFKRWMSSARPAISRQLVPAKTD